MKVLLVVLLLISVAGGAAYALEVRLKDDPLWLRGLALVAIPLIIAGVFRLLFKRARLEDLSIESDE